MDIASLIVIGTLVATTAANSIMLGLLTARVGKLLEFAYESRGRTLAQVKHLHGG